jgi:hypothetical protein
MKTLLIAFLLLPFGILAQNQLVTVQVTITNTAGVSNGNTITNNSQVRTWTNNVTAAASQIATATNISLSVSNLQVAYSFFGIPGQMVYSPASNILAFAGYLGTNITINVSAGWATVSYSTNYSTNIWPLRLPLDSSEGLGMQTNLSSALVRALNLANTNAGGITLRGTLIPSNALALWPTAPVTRGDSYIGSSNGFLYLLISTNGATGSATWTATNKLGW